MLNTKSQRGYFGQLLFDAMRQDEDIHLISIDLGYGVFDEHFRVFGRRCVNTGAAEQAAMDMAVGMALSGKKPYIYSITPFLLYRPFETIRTYINHEKIPVRLIGSGRGQDYAHDGFSHDASDDREIMATMQNISSHWPETMDELTSIFQSSLTTKSPIYINLTR